MTFNEVTIFVFERELRLVADNRGICLVSKSGFHPDSVETAVKPLGKSNFGRALQLVIPIFLERELADISSGDFVVAWEQVQHLYDKDFGLASWLPAACPFSLSIESQGSLADSDCKLKYVFYHGETQVFCNRIGSLVAHGSKLYCLPPSLFRILSTIDQFNSSAAKDKATSARLLAEIKSLAESERVNFDEYLKRENIVVPKSAELGLSFDSAGRLSLFPQIETLDEDVCRSFFSRFSDVQDIYDVDTADGGRLRVVLSPDLKEVAERMRRVSHVSGAARDRILAEPMSVFDGVSNADCVNLAQFGPRVKGIGPYVFQPTPYIKAVSGRFLDLETSSVFSDSEADEKRFEIGILAKDGDGEDVKISFSSPEDVERVLHKVQHSLADNESVVKLTDDSGTERIVPLSKNFEAGLKDLLEQVKPPEVREKTSSNSRKYLLIYENEDELDYAEEISEHSAPAWRFESPSSLVTSVDGTSFALKPYQERGIGWLQNSLSNSIGSVATLSSKRGVLLADDMGLGKTLQVLSFLAWAIEKEICPELSAETGPYKPILVVAPVILLENWKSEIASYFKSEGAIFYPFDLLYDARLKSYRVADAAGREYEVGQPTLDVQKLKQHRLIITNYDTVKNYQHSFAMIDWSIVIVDEAQKIKEPKTAVTWALKSLNALFKVALTGTPVENRLLDLWNITDFFHPGLLGSAREFSSSYEAGVELMDSDQRRKKGEELQKKLRYNEDSAFVLRRTKTDELKGLPPKMEHIVESPVSNEQIALQQQIVSEIRKARQSSRGRHLRAVQRLARLYQHSSLETDTRLDRDVRAYVEQSPKLQSVLSLLEKIKAKNEKVLIFAVYTKMQLILQKAIAEKFKFTPEIVNGTISSKVGSDGSLRRKIIQRFERKSGFNVLILSPEVAGVGLTITAANNVIHYGRWWNPAKEAQATDRVYRLGQQLPVNVYYPISVSPSFTSFDIRLHELLQRKKDLARDFLVPHDSLDINADELSDGLDTSMASVGSDKFIKTITSIDDLDSESFAALCSMMGAAQGFESNLIPSEEALGASVLMYNKDRLRIGFCLFSLEKRDVSIPIESVSRALVFFRKWVLDLKRGKREVEAVIYASQKLDRQTEAALKNLSINSSRRKEIENFLKRTKLSLPKLNSVSDGALSTLGEFAEILSAAD